MKKILLLMIVILGISALITVSVYAESYGDLTYTISNYEATITGYEYYYIFPGPELTIPNGIISNSNVYYPVKHIGSGAFCNTTSLKNVTIMSGITTIGSGAFRNCYGLTDISIPNSITSIRESAFENCYGLTKLLLPDSVTSIGYRAFENCNIDIVFYTGTKAQWEVVVGNDNFSDATIVFNATQRTYTFETNCDATLSDITDYAVLQQPEVKNEGSKLIGWYDNEEFNGSPVTFPYFGESTTLYASWNSVTTEEKTDEYKINSITIKDISGKELTTFPIETFLANVSFTNVSSSTDTLIILAQYTSSGIFKGLMYIQTEDMPTGSTMKLSIPVDNSKGDIVKLKAFCWESFGSLNPTGNSVSFPAE